MASPAFVNTGTFGSVANGTSVTGTLPATRTTGNFLFAWVELNGLASVSWSTGWIPGDSIDNASNGAAWAWRYVDGTETNPTATWTGVSLNAVIDIHQYSGVVAASPIGAFSQNIGSGTAVSCPSIVTSRAASTVLAMLFCVTNQTIPTPSGYTTRFNVGGTLGSSRIADQTQASAGSSSTAIAATIASDFWVAMTFELCSVTPPPSNSELPMMGVS